MKTPPFGVPDTSGEAVYAALRKDVAARLKNVCASWSDEDFEAVVEKVTQTALKYIQLDATARRGHLAARSEKQENPM